MLPAGTHDGHQSDMHGLHLSRWDVHLVKVKYCDARATEQHIKLKHALAQRCNKVHTILVGVMGTNYKYPSVSLAWTSAKNPAHDLNTQSIQYATKSRRLKSNTGKSTWLCSKSS